MTHSNSRRTHVLYSRRRQSLSFISLY